MVLNKIYVIGLNCVLWESEWLFWGQEEDITTAFGVSYKNKIRRIVVNFYAERELCMGNTYFNAKYINKYAWVGRG